MNKVMHVIPNVSMINGHNGLTEIARKAKVDTQNLDPGEFVLFVNKAFSACKLLAHSGVLIHYKHPKSHRLDYRALRLIPHFFDGKDIRYPDALREVFRKHYPSLFIEKRQSK